MAVSGQATVQFISVLWVVTTCLCAGSVTLDTDYATQAANSLMLRYSPHRNSSTQGLTSEQFQLLLQKATSHSEKYIETVFGDCQGDNETCGWKIKCPGIEEIFQTYAVGDHLQTQGFIEALPVALNTLTSKHCIRGAKEGNYHVRNKKKPTTAQAWGYGMGFVSLVIVISNIGACLGPLMEKKFFKRVLQFLVAMGAGSLASTGLMVLIPEAFDVISIEELDGYVWKSTVAIFSIYVFFSSERLLKTCLYNSQRKRRGRQEISITVSEPAENNVEEIPQILEPLTEKKNGHGHSHGHTDQQSHEKMTLAWMVMAGDVIHNFVDGLSIGAAFTEDVALGISISLAVVCEELPHELADIAILLHSGLSMKKSLFINFLSACVCYIGLVIGILLGSMVSEASKWIFAMAGGLFLYVPLVDMFPDMSNHLDSLLGHANREAGIVALLHVLGLTIGAGIIIFIVNIGAYIVV